MPRVAAASGWAARHVGWIWTACVVVVIALVAALGGLRARTDQRIDLEPGTPVALGVADVAVISATAEFMFSTWRLDVRIDLTNTTDLPITAGALDSAVQIVYINDAGVEHIGWPVMVVLDGATGAEIGSRMAIPPDSGTVSVILRESAYDGFDPDRGIRVGLYPVTYRNNTILSLSSEKNWVMDKTAPDFHYWVVIPPLEIVEN